VNEYARSKARGEAAVRELLPDRHVILRTSWVYGPDVVRRNFALRLVDRLRQGEKVPVPSDQWGCPTYTEDLAAATLALVEQGVTGTFHACGAEIIDRVALGRLICACFGVSDAGLVPTPTAALGQAAPRPLRVAMDCSKLARTVAVPFRDLRAGLARLAAADGIS
jgi:dTDP-4-dehydrorhamnose reductase